MIKKTAIIGKNALYSSGQTMLIAVIFFLLISLIIVIGISRPILMQVKDSLDLERSKEAYYLAEGGMEDSLYKLKNNLTLVSGGVVNIGDRTATITVTDTPSGKTIDAVGNVGGITRKIETEVVQGIPISFNYAAQSGVGGINLSGGSLINGPENMGSQPFPISGSNIQEWKNEASLGPTIEDLSIGSNATTGPLVVTGNLTVNSGSILDMTGTVWVKGNVVFAGGAHLVLDSSFGTAGGVLISDGYMDISGGASFVGSGAPASYPLLITTNQCPTGSGCNGHNAINIYGGASTSLLNAQNGKISMAGGTRALSLSASSVSIDGGSLINYNSGLANVYFANGRATSWYVASWNEM